jgi:hypothetical protein
MNEKEILSSLVILAEDTVDFLSSKRKWETECWVCIEFLKALKICVSQTDLIKPKSEPPDVICRGANFEVFIILDKDRKLHADWKKKLFLYKNAKSLEDLLEPYNPPTKIPAKRILDFLKPTLSKKQQNYIQRGISLGDIDVLAYVNLIEYSLDLDTPFPDLDDLHQQGWRSISVFGKSYCRVLYAEESAPDFLCSHAGNTIPVALE